VLAWSTVENGEKEMKVYNNPKIEIVELDENDIITTSPGTETTPKDEPDGIWDLNL
jgi:hypothetical protein